MGSCFTCELFDGKLNSSELRRQYEARLVELTYEYGHDAYNGTLATTSGLVIDDKTFDSRQAAEEYVMNNTQKWEAARAVKVKDIRTEIVKSPTYNGKKASFPLAINTTNLRSVASIWDDTRRENVFIAADQLVESQKAKAIALYNDWHTKNRAFDALRNAIAKICQRLQDSSAPAPQPSDFKELQKAIKQRARAHAAEKKAAEKLVAFDLKQAAKIYATKQVDHGVQWLVGGWAAE